MAETKTYPIVWDQTGERTYETGVRKVVLYLYDDGNDGKPKGYNSGVAWNGVTAINESPSGADATNLYANDGKYLVLRAAEEFSATIEAYTYPDEFNECNGEAELIAGIVVGQQPRRSFGLCYRTAVGNDTELDAYGYKLHFIYGATCSPSSRDYQTINDSPEAITFSWEMSTVPVEIGTIGGVDYKSTATLTIDSTKLNATGKANLAKLEEMLYGKGSTAPVLPLPDKVIEIMTATA